MSDNYKQVIVVRKDLNMTPGKLASQVSHASMAPITRELRKNAYRLDSKTVRSILDVDYQTWKEWYEGSFTKIILKAKNKNDLEKLIKKAQEAGMQENIDYYCIRDNCLTELHPEENGRCLTCVGFKPTKATIIDQITKKYQLYK